MSGQDNAAYTRIPAVSQALGFCGVPFVMKATPKTTSEIIRVLDELVGRGNYVYDTVEDVWVALDPSYTGSGRGFLLFEPAGYWSHFELPAALS